MQAALAPDLAGGRQLPGRNVELFEAHREKIFVRTDRIFAGLLAFEWLFGIGLAWIVSPLAWEGMSTRVHAHVLAAVFLGGAIAAFPILQALTKPGRTLTRHSIAVAQMLYSALLIHLTGGRIETHFHIFGSLAFLAFYRDWRVLITASIVVAADHYLRGLFWPQSVYGVLTPGGWRWLEHGAWVIFEDVFLILSCRQGTSEMQSLANRQAQVENARNDLELRVAERTAALAAANRGLTAEVEERQRAEGALRTSEERYRLMFENNPQSMWVFDRESLAFLAVNAAAIAQYGYSRDEFLALTIKDIRPPEDVGGLLEDIRSSDLHKQGKEWRHRRRDGTAISVQIWSDDIDFLGRPASLVIATDVTERKQIEIQLRQSQKLDAIGSLAGGVAHDFNNLLTIITGQAQLLQVSLPAGGPGSERLEEILGAAHRASTLTRQLLAFSRKQVLAPTILNLNETVTESLRMVRRLIGEDIDLVVATGSHLGRVKADPGQIDQILMNLAVNARDAMPRGGKLTVETADVELDETFQRQHPSVIPGRYVMLAMSDTGCGMDAETQARIFEPFFTTKGVGEGTGLGLATIYGIVKQSDGFIFAYSELGHGTTFKIYLPRVEAPAGRSSVRQKAPPVEWPRGHETVLLVEDERAVRALLRDVLVGQGYTVLEAASGVEALAFTDSFSGQIHLVLTDVVMPGLSGREFVEKFRPRHPDTRVLFMSGYTDDAVVRHGIISHDMEFLQKPFTTESLLLKVRDVLGGEQRAA